MTSIQLVNYPKNIIAKEFNESELAEAVGNGTEKNGRYFKLSTFGFSYRGKL